MSGKYSPYLSIDMFARHSRLNRLSPMAKFIFVLLCMTAGIASPILYTGLIQTVLFSAVTVGFGGVRLRDYLRLFTIPLSFLMLSGIALMIDTCITPDALKNTALVTCRALGAFSALYFLILSTPMHELIDVFRRLHFPNIIINLMYLMYRCIFILLAMHHTMKISAESRMGFINYRTSLHTTGQIYANLLHRSYQTASEMFDAMESRCFRGEIRFLNRRKK